MSDDAFSQEEIDELLSKVEKDKPKTNGGTAFPVYAWQGTVDPGMTLLDYYYGQALVGLCANSVIMEANPIEDVVEWAVKLGKALLAEREKNNAGN